MILTLILFLLVLDAAAMGLWYACSYPRSCWLGHPVVENAGRRWVALTFDDGPSEQTPAVLNVLRSRNVRATFFVCGRAVEQNPEFVRTIVEQGHAIGNHTYSHRYLYFHSRSAIEQEIDRTQDAVADACGVRPGLFRPPYGARWFGLPKVLRERGMRLVHWSVNALDWKLAPPQVVETVMRCVRPGSVVLLHDGRQAPSTIRGIRRTADAGIASAQSTVAALPEIIDGLLTQGFELVTVEQMLADCAGHRPGRS